MGYYDRSFFPRINLSIEVIFVEIWSAEILCIFLASWLKGMGF